MPRADGFVVAMDDSGRQHAYPPRVRLSIPEADAGAYRRAADYLNASQIDVISVQHEYGIFGAKAGAHVLTLLRELRMPIVTTLHTVLSSPNPAQRSVMESLARVSDRLVVMSASGADLLMRVHGIASARIDLIPHGIPNVPVDPGSKDRLGVGGRNVIMTFGLLSRDKGIEYVIDALPEILAVYPDTVYVVLGATHPHVVAHEGEAYRLMLESRARHLGVAGHIIFHNRFVSQHELTEFLSAADIYITPYLQPEQITSGTLAYAAGAGKAVISTPYTYARELLADDRGMLVPYRDSASIARAVITIAGDTEHREMMCARAAAQGAAMSWPAVAIQYLDTFAKAGLEHAHRRRTALEGQTLAARDVSLPDVNLKHVQALTDDTGMVQHALYSIPRYDDGYCVDDNARALLLMAVLEETGSDDPRGVRTLASRYLAFLAHAFETSTGQFRNFLSYSRCWSDGCGSEDSHARAVWALGAVAGRMDDGGRRALAVDLFRAGAPALTRFTSPRAWAYGLLGIDEYLRVFPLDDGLEPLREDLSGRLLRLLQTTRREDWVWFEESLTYCNARLPQALLVSGDRMGRSDLTAAGLESLAWLVAQQTTPDGQFAGIGSNGFYVRGTARANFDQQPVEACATVSACLDAYRVTREARWLSHARSAFDWFLGGNHLNEWLFDPSTGGCRDGLHADRVNQNQGAEATLSFLLALHAMRSADSALVASEPIQLELQHA